MEQQSPELRENNLILLICSSILFTLFLFFIDEGYYNFSWMTSIGSWLIFIVYASIIFLGQFVVSSLIRGFVRSFRRSLLSVVIGTTIGLAVLFNIGF